MKVKFVAECEIPDIKLDPKEFIQKELDSALFVLRNEYPGGQTLENLEVESVEVIPDTDPKCPKCGSKDIVVTMAASKDDMKYHCYDCGHDFHCKELKKEN